MTPAPQPLAEHPLVVADAPRLLQLAVHSGNPFTVQAVLAHWPPAPLANAPLLPLPLVEDLVFAFLTYNHRPSRSTQPAALAGQELLQLLCELTVVPAAHCWLDQCERMVFDACKRAWRAVGQASVPRMATLALLPTWRWALLRWVWWSSSELAGDLGRLIKEWLEALPAWVRDGAGNKPRLSDPQVLCVSPVCMPIQPLLCVYGVSACSYLCACMHKL